MPDGFCGPSSGEVRDDGSSREKNTSFRVVHTIPQLSHFFFVFCACLFRSPGGRLLLRGPVLGPVSQRSGSQWADLGTLQQCRLCGLVALRSCRAPPAVRSLARAAWARRRWSVLSTAVQQAIGHTALGRARAVPGPARRVGCRPWMRCWHSRLPTPPAGSRCAD